jgi:glycosyltransferase involved in cell wall biosynthesis
MSDTRVLILCPQLRLGGAERHVAVLAPALRARGFDVAVVALVHGGPLLNQLRHAGVRADCARMRSRVDLFGLRRALALAGPVADVVVSQSVNAHVVGALVARRTGAAHLAIEHAGRNLGMAAHRRVLVRLIAPRLDAVVAVSASQLPELVRLGYAPEQLRVIANGVPEPVVERARGEVRGELGLAETDFVALLLAGLRPEKRVELFIDAVAAARAREPRIRGVVAGGGSALQAVREHAAVLGATAVLGERTDAPDLIAAADVLCLTSTTEGVPISILEGMALGTPTLATAVGGIPGVVGDGESGVLVESGSVEAFAAALCGLARDPDRVDALARGARRLYETTYTIDHVADAYATLIRELVSARRPHR